MTEPTRLLAMPESELERALLDAGRSYTASSSMRAKTLVALGLTAVATSSAPSAAAASKSLTKATFSKVAVAVIVIGAAAVPIWRYFAQASARVAPPPAARAALVLPAPSAAVPSEAAPLVTAPSVTAPSASVAVAQLQPSAAALNTGTASSVRAEPRPVSVPPLAAELAALDAARTSLSHSDPSAALVALDGYSRNFPRGRLRIEAEVLRIGALAKSGQTDAARKRAEAFLRRHPDSVLASRVRSYAGL
ncbi:MAG: hypothetical protein WDO69_12575 [Pseudomonadota bacterium]